MVKSNINMEMPKMSIRISKTTKSNESLSQQMSRMFRCCELSGKIYGCGIAPNKLERLFRGDLAQDQPVADSRRRNMGIGLSVCAAIVKAHDGRIWAENLPQAGARVSFALKLEESHEQ